MPEVDELMESSEYSYIVNDNVKWYNHFGKITGSSFIKLNKYLPYNPAMLFLSIYLRKTKTCVH